MKVVLLLLLASEEVPGSDAPPKPSIQLIGE